MPDATPETLCDAILFAMSIHLDAHRDAQRVQQLPAPRTDCALCQALQGALGLAHALTETPTHQRRTRV
jgi:hypothetical protein